MKPNGGHILCREKSSKYNAGQGWVIDGFVQYQFEGNAIIGYYDIGDVLFHCVWGYSDFGQSSCNGYFYYNGGFSGAPIEKEDDDGFGGELPSDYSVNLQYLGGFIPNK